MMSDEGQRKGGSPAVERAVRILEYLAHVQSEASLADIASALSLNKSTCFNILKTLQESAMVVRDGRFPVYRLGPKLVELGTASRRNYSYRGIVKRELSPLIERFEVTCLLAQLLPHDAGIVVTDRIAPHQGHGPTAPIGQVHPLSVPAMGRAVLATRPFTALVALMDNLSVGAGEEMSRFAAELEAVRERGFATSLEEYTPGVNAVATTILDAEGEIALILCLMGTADSFPEVDVMRAGADLVEKSQHVAFALSGHGPSRLDALVSAPPDPERTGSY